MNTMTWRVRVLAVLCLGGLAGCGGDGGPTGPEPGALVVNLTAPNADDAAILLRVIGVGITQVSASQAGTYLKVLQDGNTLTAVLVGNLATGALMRFNVPDVNALGSYSATIVQVADEKNALRALLAGYALNLVEAAG